MVVVMSQRKRRWGGAGHVPAVLGLSY